VASGDKRPAHASLKKDFVRVFPCPLHFAPSGEGRETLRTREIGSTPGPNARTYRGRWVEENLASGQDGSPSSSSFPPKLVCSEGEFPTLRTAAARLSLAPLADNLELSQGKQLEGPPLLFPLTRSFSLTPSSTRALGRWRESQSSAGLQVAGRGHPRATRSRVPIRGRKSSKSCQPRGQRRRFCSPPPSSTRASTLHIREAPSSIGRRRSEIRREKGGSVRRSTSCVHRYLSRRIALSQRMYYTSVGGRSANEEVCMRGREQTLE